MRTREKLRGPGIAVLAVLLTSGVIASSAQQTTARAEDRAVKEEVLQNNPNTDDRTEIRDRLVDLIEGAEDDSDITIASYHFDDKQVANALASAMGPDRRVRVRIVVGDGKDFTETYRKVKDAVGTSPGSLIEICGEPKDPGEPKGDPNLTSCMADHIMHNKFFLFEHTDGADNVVVQTSANLDAGSGTDMWNTAYIKPGDRWLYRQFELYFDELRAHADPDVNDDDYYHSHPPTSNGKFKIYHSPRRTGNTFYNILGNVECHGNTSGGTSDNNRTIIRVSMFSFRGDDARAIASRLWLLDSQGCYVDIVATDFGKSTRDGKRGPLFDLLAGPIQWPFQPNYHGPEVREFSGKQCGVHEKNLLIDGFYDGEKNQKVVFTGSHNFNTKSLRDNDETILRIDDPEIHDQFKEHFFDVRDAAAITWQTSKYDVDLSKHKFNC
jgi:phosphatidylserine/phosphatidylglycerophosphate/cardiolipin synthase-like enzyme